MVIDCPFIVITGPFIVITGPFIVITGLDPVIWHGTAPGLTRETIEVHALPDSRVEPGHDDERPRDALKSLMLARMGPDPGIN